MTWSDRLARFFRRGAPAATESGHETLPPKRWQDQFPDRAAVDRWLRERSAGGRLYGDLSEGAVQSVAARFPDRVEQVRRAAERIVAHDFNLLGSGSFVPIDPDRSSTPSGYRPIDWTLDPVSGHRFPSGFRHSAWTAAMRPGLADIKLPWELGRCQHWVPLGQAFRLTGDERFAEEVVRQHADFLDANPVGIGVQYVCTMDVAIRAFNWALAFELIRTANAFGDHVQRRAYESLFDHGVFIEGNLENKYEVTSNHFLSNVVGLYGVGRVFADLPEGERWSRQCREWLEQEMRVQVLEDGADYESSIPYHRLVLELFLAGAKLARLDGAPLSPEFHERLRRMGEFLFSVLRPDGLMPQVGDADDGRLHIFSDYGEWPPQDARHLAGPMSSFFAEPLWASIGGEIGGWEAAWWGERVETDRGESSVRRVARLFQHAGVAVAAQGGSYLMVTNGRVGTSGFGNHKHNDLLSFELHLDDVPLIVDPGSYVYTSDPDARNLFRSTHYHNTVCVDATEQNDLKPEFLFRLFETSTVEHLTFEETCDGVRYRGRHTGYARLPEPIEHERTFEFDSQAGSLSVSDVLRGAGTHRLAWHFHLAPGVAADLLGPNSATLSARHLQFHFTAPADVRLIVENAWYSPSYGVRIPCLAIACSIEAAASDERRYVFYIGREAPQRP